MKPTIAITIGDFNGIGPEVAVKSINKKEILAFCNPILIADAEVLDLLKIRLDKDMRTVLLQHQLARLQSPRQVLNLKAIQIYYKSILKLIQF